MPQYLVMKHSKKGDKRQGEGKSTGKKIQYQTERKRCAQLSAKRGPNRQNQKGEAKRKSSSTGITTKLNRINVIGRENTRSRADSARPPILLLISPLHNRDDLSLLES